MQVMSIVVFWLQHPQGMNGNLYPTADFKSFQDTEMTEAMAFVREKRAAVGTSHVDMVNEPEGMVGTKDAGGAVQDGKLPDGSDYTWMKRRSS